MKHFFIKISLSVAITFTTISCSQKSTATTATPSAQTSSVKNEATGNIVEGEKTYNNKCGSCHRLIQPSEFTSKEWVPILRSMCKKAKLDEIEKANVTAYVMSIAK